MRPLQYRWLWLVPGSAWLAWLTAASLAPVPSEMPLPSDKLMHIGAYCTLLYLFGCCFKPGKLPLLVVLGALLGLVIELIQSTTGYRSFEWADGLANLSGAILGGVLALSPAGQLFMRLEAMGRERG